MISLKELIGAIDPARAAALSETPVTGVECDSRKLQEGNVFVAIKGVKQDGNVFIRDAAARGAAAVVGEMPVEGLPVPFIQVEDSRIAAARLAAAFFGHPARSMKIVGITGTNGKTTSSYLLEHCLTKLGRKAGVVGTVNYRSAGREIPAVETTPGPVKLQELLAVMKKDGCDAVIMEVSSHALDQHRVAGIPFEVALFTNLTQDHLDYHKTLDAYFDCKARLFEGLDASKTAAINADDEWGRKLFSRTAAKIISYGIKEKTNLRAESIVAEPGHTVFTLNDAGQKTTVRLPLVGIHNVYNALGAVAVLKGLGFPVTQCVRHLETFEGVPGRLEAVRCGQNFEVFVDFAHTPDGLQNVLSALRECRKSKLTVVFGCGGDRDRAKRPLMAAIAARLCDTVVITSDNPRSEDPRRILDEIQAGFPEGFTNFAADVDRRRAIRRALLDAREGDIVLLAGKGHERTQIVGSQVLPFSDREEAERVLNGR